MATATTDLRTGIAHPLDPLSADEIARAWALIRTERAPGPRTRVISIALHEPPKDVVLRTSRAIPSSARPSSSRSTMPPARPTRPWCR